MRATRAEVDLDAVAHNVCALRELVAPAALCAVVKADGYGHGAIAVGRAAVEAGATWLGVALVEEGAVLRRSGIDVPILLLSQPRPADIDSAVQLGLRLSVYTADGIDAIAAAARRHQGHRAGAPQGEHRHEPRRGRARRDPGAGPVDRRATRAGLRGALDALRRRRRADRTDFTDVQLDRFDEVTRRSAATPGWCRRCATRPTPPPPSITRAAATTWCGWASASTASRPARRSPVGSTCVPPSSCGPRWRWSSGCRRATASRTA